MANADIRKTENSNTANVIRSLTKVPRFISIFLISTFYFRFSFLFFCLCPVPRMTRPARRSGGPAGRTSRPATRIDRPAGKDDLSGSEEWSSREADDSSWSQDCSIRRPCSMVLFKKSAIAGEALGIKACKTVV